MSSLLGGHTISTDYRPFLVSKPIDYRDASLRPVHEKYLSMRLAVGRSVWQLWGGALPFRRVCGHLDLTLDLGANTEVRTFWDATEAGSGLLNAIPCCRYIAARL